MNETPLIARKTFFSNPDRASVRISPDGTRLSWLAPLDGVLNVWVAPRGDLAAARAVTRDTGRGIHYYWWAFTNDHILYLQDKNGDENWRIHAVDLSTGDARDLTPFEGVQAQPLATSHKFPGEIVVGLNNRNAQWHDIYRIRLATGERTLLLQHDRFLGVAVDNDYRLRLAAQMRPDGGVDQYIPVDEAVGGGGGDAVREGGEWRLWDTFPAEDLLTTGHAGFDETGQTLFMKDSRGRNTSALVAVDLKTKAARLLAEDARADAADVAMDSTETRVQAVSFIYDRKQWRVLDPSIEVDFAYLRTVADGDFEIVSRSLDDRLWVVAYTVDDGPARYYLYDRSDRSKRSGHPDNGLYVVPPSGSQLGHGEPSPDATDRPTPAARLKAELHTGPGASGESPNARLKAELHTGPRDSGESSANGTETFLFTNRQALEGLPLARMRSVVIRSRDGLDLVAYYTLPLGSDADGDGIPDRPLPMVFAPHGGPWHRDYWGYNSWHQWLANRGYAVLSVNFRSSTGFGKAFTNAGDREWGGKIMEDQVDAVQWAIGAGIADPARVAVMGGSFGGYSTLAGLTFTPELFACGVDMVGIANLVTWMESVPAYWKPMLDLLTTRVGDVRTEEGRALLRKHSPLTYADRICRPLLIGQGANDPRVKQAESDQIVEAMQAKSIPVTYLLYPDEGHGFARPENNLSFYAVAEAFLAKCLGGRVEPIGEDFQGSSIQVVTGAYEIPGLSDEPR